MNEEAFTLVEMKRNKLDEDEEDLYIQILILKCLEEFTG